MAEAKKLGVSYWSLVEPAWKSLNGSWDAGPAGFLHQFRAARPEVGHLYAAHWCQSEVCNGGFHQFFSNSTGLLAPESLAGFQAIGLGKWSEILRTAMEFFGRPYPREQVNRQELLANCSGRKREEWDPFYRLDQRFFEWLHAEPDRWCRAADAYARRANT
jgi:Domain of unknown function (DUF4375)